jgi:uncharacterized protein
MEGSEVMAAIARLVYFCALMSLFGVAQGVEKEIPSFSGLFNDLAKIVPAETAARISNKLESLEKRTGAQVAVLTITSLDGATLEEYSIRVTESWKLGRKGINDGVLLLIVPGERRMRVEVGYGLEDKLTDLQSSRIIESIVTPLFRAGDMAGGIEAGVDAIIGVIETGIDVEPSPRSSEAKPAHWTYGSILAFGAIIFVLFGGAFAILTGLPGLFGWLGGGFFGYIIYLSCDESLGKAWAIVIAAVWIVLIVIVRILRGRRSFALDFGSGASRSSSSRGSFSSSSGTGASRETESGRGGGFGGGGASGNW